jgi:hypothetical protein
MDEERDFTIYLRLTRKGRSRVQSQRLVTVINIPETFRTWEYSFLLRLGRLCVGGGFGLGF